MSQLNKLPPIVDVDGNPISLGILCPFKGGQALDLDYYFYADYNDIVQAGHDIPAVIEWINALLQQMYEDKLNLDAELAEIKAKAYFDLKSGAYQDAYGHKPSEDGLAMAINLNDEVQDTRRRLNNTKAWVLRLNKTILSFQTKLDLVRSSEATRRRLVEPAELELDREAARRKRQGEQDDEENIEG